MNFDDNMTVKEVREYLQEHMDESNKCPCCTRLVRPYKRSIVVSAAKALIDAYKWFKAHPDQEWVHVNDLGLGQEVGGNWAKLRYWRLIEEKPNPDDPTKNHAGYWKLTEIGRKFVRREITLSKKLMIYMRRGIGFEGELVDIVQCLGNAFNYTEMMRDI